MANAPPVSIQIASGVEAPARPASLRRWACATLDHIDQSGALCIRVVGADEMTDLNARFRRKRGTTNVLSFPADADDYALEPPQLGDVAICAPVVVSEAAAQGKRAADHLAHLVVHGVLHLCGYDHVKAKDAKVMEAHEVAILNGLGIEDPYLARTVHKVKPA